MKKFVILLFLIFLFSFNFSIVYAFGGGDDASGEMITNPLKDNVDSIPGLVQLILKSLLGIVGAIALAVFTFSGFRMIFFAHDSKAYDSAKNAMLWATAGLFVIFSSYTVLKYVISAMTT